MKFRTFYDLAIEKGLKEDQRSQKDIDEVLKNAGKEYRQTKGREKSAFDTERLKHTYADTRMLNGTGDEEIRNVLVGIDVESSELVLADRLRDRGVKIDLVVSHHPEGPALAQLHRVMAIQPSLWKKYGLSQEVANGIMKDRMSEVERGIAPTNHARAVDTARLLGIPFMCMHTPADNCVANFLQKLFNKQKPKKLKNVLSLLMAIPEYYDAMKKSAGPFILIGDKETDAGKVFVDMTGGTSGPNKMFSRLSQSGVKTVIGMHCKETGYKMARTEFINYVIAGHIASDNLGMNILLDAIEKKGKLKVIECSGFKRVKRK